MTSHDEHMPAPAPPASSVRPAPPAEHAGRPHGMPEPSWLAPRLALKLRMKLADSITHLTAADTGPPIDYALPPGDPGLFGPQSVCWKVYADFTSMMAGGICALLMQTLHPLALAGVWDHSTFRTDLAGRLRRTATFITGTTYGGRADALALIEQVKRIHLAVNGVAPDGRAYRASDPMLLTWVHVAEVSSFLAGYLRYVDPALPEAAQDQYYSETAHVARMLGAADVPCSRAAIAAYLHAMRLELEVGERTREVVRVVMEAPAPRPSMRPAGALMRHAGIDLLPPWAQQMLGFERHATLRRALVQPGIRAIAPVLRWALVNGVPARARRRANAWGAS